MSLTGDFVYPNYQKDLIQADQLHRDTHIGTAAQADASNKCGAEVYRSQLPSFKVSPCNSGPGQSGSGVRCGRYTAREEPAGRHRHFEACS